MPGVGCTGVVCSDSFPLWQMYKQEQRHLFILSVKEPIRLKVKNTYNSYITTLTAVCYLDNQVA